TLRARAWRASKAERADRSRAQPRATTAGTPLRCCGRPTTSGSSPGDPTTKGRSSSILMGRSRINPPGSTTALSPGNGSRADPSLGREQLVEDLRERVDAEAQVTVFWMQVHACRRDVRREPLPVGEGHH